MSTRASLRTRTVGWNHCRRYTNKGSPNSGLTERHFVVEVASKSVRHIAETDVRTNGGFLAFRPEVFDYMRPGEPFQRLIAAEQLFAYRHDGFWACLETFKERQVLEEMHVGRKATWEVWNTNAPAHD